MNSRTIFKHGGNTVPINYYWGAMAPWYRCWVYMSLSWDTSTRK